MRIYDCNWKMIEEYLAHDDRIVLPIGSTEQHGYLSLGTDAILAERVAVEAAEPLGVPVLPALPFGVAPYFAAFPGSPTLRISTYLEVIRDLIDSLYGQGFRRIAVINGHAGNSPAGILLREWLATPRDSPVRLLFHDWWNAPRVWEVVQRYDVESGHASWMENFPWTRLTGVAMPTGGKRLIPQSVIRQASAAEIRRLTIDGTFGGSYQRRDDEVLEVWRTGVAEVRDVIENGWADHA